jgi:argonaute-like protein implicated in RNA metabolism and viral defense
MGARFRFVEVIKSGAPRLYEKTETIEQPAKGAAFLLSSCEAFVVSSLAPFKGSTPNPLYIRCVDNDSAFTIREAVESVLAMTLLHWGSIMPPRMPVTVSYSDKIAYLALRGVKPANAEGSLQYWL